MFTKKPFPFSLLVLVILITLHISGSYLSWYWKYPWFDTIVHAMSGLWAGLLILWLAVCSGELNSLQKYRIKCFLIAVISAVVVGVAWELLEYFSQITVISASNYYFNTATDILSDMIGGVLAYLYFTQVKKCEPESQDVLHPFYNQTGKLNKEIINV